MITNIAITFTNAAFEKAGVLLVGAPLKPRPASVCPQVGDLMRFPGLEQFWFIVIGREIQYRESETYVQIVLDLNESDQKQRAPVVHLVYSSESSPQSRSD